MSKVVTHRLLYWLHGKPAKNWVKPNASESTCAAVRHVAFELIR